MNADQIIGLAVIALGLLIMAPRIIDAILSAVIALIDRIDGDPMSYATVPRDPFYDVLRAEYAADGRDLPYDWAAAEADVRGQA